MMRHRTNKTGFCSVCTCASHVSFHLVFLGSPSGLSSALMPVTDPDASRVMLCRLKTWHERDMNGGRAQC